MKLIGRLVSEFKIESILFATFLAIYTFCASDSIVQGDTGEFLASAAVRGVPHDPGYPLYSMMTQLIFMLTHSVWALHALSGVCGALTLVFTYRLIFLLTKHTPAALFGTLSLGTYEFFMFPALVAQVHSLHVLLLSALYFFLLRAIKQEKVTDLYFVAGIFGLGVAHNHAIIFTLPSILLALWFMRNILRSNSSLSESAIWRRSRRVGKHSSPQLAFDSSGKSRIHSGRRYPNECKNILLRLCILGGLGCLGLLLYGYTIFSALQNPVLNWGRIHDIPSFLAMFFRTNYGSLSLTAGQGDGPVQYSSIMYFFTSLLTGSWYVLLPAIISLIYLKQKDKLYVLLLISWLLTGPFFFLLMHHYLYTIVHQTLIEQFLPYSFYFLAIMAGLGVRYTVAKLVSKDGDGKRIPLNDTSLVTDKRTTIAYSISIIVFFLIVAFFTVPKVNQRGMELTRDITKEQLSQLPEKSILITTADGLYFPAQYLQYTMKYRTDIRVINLTMLSPWEIQNLLEQYPDLKDIFPNGKINFATLCSKYAGAQKLYVYPWFPEFSQMFGKNCSLYPYGLVAKSSPIKNTPSLSTIKKYNDSVWNDISSQINFSSYKTKTSRVRETLYYVGEQYNYTGLYYQQNKRLDWAQAEFTKASNISPDETNSLVNSASYWFGKGNSGKAVAALEEGIQRNPANAQEYYTLGIILLKQKDLEGAYKNLKKYLTFSPPKSESYQLISNFVSSYEKNTNMYGSISQ